LTAVLIVTGVPGGGFSSTYQSASDPGTVPRTAEINFPFVADQRASCAFRTDASNVVLKGLLHSTCLRLGVSAPPLLSVQHPLDMHTTHLRIAAGLLVRAQTLRGSLLYPS
jgi:hypothetical protein